MNLLWDRVQIWWKSYIFFPRTLTKPFAKIKYSSLPEVSPLPIHCTSPMNSSVTLPSAWKVCSSLLLFQMNKIPSCSQEIVIDSNLYSHKFFLAASKHHLKEMEHLYKKSHEYEQTHLLLFPIHQA